MRPSSGRHKWRPYAWRRNAADYGARHGMAADPVAVTENPVAVTENLVALTGNPVAATDETGTAPATDGTDGKILCVNRNEKE